MNNFFKNFPEIDKNNGMPLYAQLSNALEKYIANFKKEVGTSLPTETELIKFYGISRITARKAMQRLATKGLIKKIQGKGTFVAEPRYSDFLSRIESLEENFKKNSIVVTNVPIELKIVHPMDDWLKNLNLPENSQAFGIIRQKKINENILCIEYKFLPLNIAELFDLEDLKYKPLINVLRRYPETEIFHAKYKSYSALLFPRDANLLEVKSGSPGLIRSAIYFNNQNKPILTGRKVFPADKVQIEFEINKTDENKENLVVDKNFVE